MTSEKVEREMERLVDAFHADDDSDFQAYAAEVVALRTELERLTTAIERTREALRITSPASGG
jgi:hypothetical protein